MFVVCTWKKIHIDAVSRFIHRFYCIFNLSIRIDCTCRSFFTVVSTLSDRSTSRLIFCLCFFLITGIWNSRWHQVLLIYITDTLWYGYGTLAILRSTFNLFSKIVRFAPVFVLWFFFFQIRNSISRRFHGLICSLFQVSLPVLINCLD